MKLSALFFLPAVVCLLGCASTGMQQNSAETSMATRVEFPSELEQFEEVSRAGYKQLKEEIITQEIRGSWICFAIVEMQDQIVGENERVIRASPGFYRVRRGMLWP